MLDMHFAIERFHAQLIPHLPMETRAGLIAEIQIAASVRGDSISDSLEALSDEDLIALYDATPVIQAP